MEYNEAPWPRKMAVERRPENIVVLGSVNVDLVMHQERLAQPGETVLGGEFRQVPGGKGANQAVGAARASHASVTFLGATGDDDLGRASRAALEHASVVTRHLKIVPGHSTGVAMILVDRAGENTICVASGANQWLLPLDIEALPREVFQNARVFLASLETPLASVEVGLKLAKASGLTTILNPAPADRGILHPEFLGNVDLLTPNEQEFEVLTGVTLTNEDDARRGAAELQRLGCPVCIVTRGSRGCLLITANHCGHISALEGVTPIDTTGAGDAFNGALAVALAEGATLREAARFANRAAGISVTRRGAQASLATRTEIDQAEDLVREMVRATQVLETSPARTDAGPVQFAPPSAILPLYAEPATSGTSQATIDVAMRDLKEGSLRWPSLLSHRKVELVERCLNELARLGRAWQEAACEAKGLDPDTAAGSEEWLAGPVTVARHLQLIARVTRDIGAHGRPLGVAQARPGPVGNTCLTIFPTAGLFDRWVFRGFRADVWFQGDKSASRSMIHAWNAHRELRFEEERAKPGVVVVLGAGNVSSICATDALSKIFDEGQSVLLKMNPVNAYLGSILEEIFKPLVDANLLRVVQGGAEVGGYCANHPLAASVHITGSRHAHDALVWGPPGPERDARRAEGRPRLSKPITSELGNVTPWIIIPSNYSEQDLQFQAENLAMMIVNNAGFNCITARMVITWTRWQQRTRFLDMVDEYLRCIPTRRAYYPGAQDRYARFVGQATPNAPDGNPPWTLVRDVHPERDRHFFTEESFVCICAETAIDAPDNFAFFDRACDFANERVWGTLAAGVMAPKLDRAHPTEVPRFWQAVSRLRYGTVAVNHWPGVAFATMCTPWGAYPGGTLLEPHSGIGFVHNTYRLADVEKTVLFGPRYVRPKPIWFPTNRQAARLARQAFSMVCRPRVWKLARLLPSALLG